MRKLLLISGLFVFIFQFVQAQSSLLQSGPMLGYSEMREVMLWVQTTKEARVKIKYWKMGETNYHFTEEITTKKKEAFSAHLLADEVEPGETYQYELYINAYRVERPYPLRFKTRPLWQYREDPPNVRIAIGSCNYYSEEKYDRPGDPYGAGYEIFTSIYQKNPDLMVWLGDNLYFREADWNTRTGIMYRYTRTRSMPELQPLLAATHHYAIWDDHDYGPNDADFSYAHKDLTREAFTTFWANPGYGTEHCKGITGAFQWGGADFFMLDNRWDRSQNEAKTGKKQILGDAQIDWLIASLKNSGSPFKFVCIGGQVLNDVDKWENYIHVAPEERKMLLDRIQKEGIKGVIFLSGDRHKSEFSEYRVAGKPTIWDFTVSPLTSTAYDSKDEANTLRVEGSHYGQRNFATLDLSGPFRKRELTMTLWDAKGVKRWEMKLKEEDL